MKAVYQFSQVGVVLGTDRQGNIGAKSYRMAWGGWDGFHGSVFRRCLGGGCIATLSKLEHNSYQPKGKNRPSLLLL